MFGDEHNLSVFCRVRGVAIAGVIEEGSERIQDAVEQQQEKRLGSN